MKDVEENKRRSQNTINELRTLSIDLESLRRTIDQIDITYSRSLEELRQGLNPKTTVENVDL